MTMIDAFPRDISQAFKNSGALQRENDPAPMRTWVNNRQAGVTVNHDIAMTYSALWAAVRLVAETLSVMPMQLFEDLPNGGKRKRDDLPLHTILRRRPNPEMTAMSFREVLTAHALCWGNGYAEIVRNNGGAVSELWPLLPDRMHVRRIDGRLLYEYRPSLGDAVFFEPRDILHIKGLGFDGLVGYDVVSYHAMSLGVGIAAQVHSASFFGNSTQLQGVLSHPSNLSDLARENLRKEWESVYRGPQNAFRMAVLEEGLKFEPLGIEPRAAQLIEARKFNITDVARIMRVPPHKIGDLEKATFSNIEEQNLEFLGDTMMPWITRWEQECEAKLLGAVLRQNHEIRLNVTSLKRGDLKSRYETYKIGRDGGWLSANDIREMEDLDPLDGDIGDLYLVPLNFQRAEDAAHPPENEPAPDESIETEAPDQDIENAMRPALHDAAARITRREQNVMLRAWDKHRGSEPFHAAMTDELEKQRSYAIAMLGPPALSYGLLIKLTAADVAQCVERIAAEYRDRRWQDYSNAHLAGEFPRELDGACDQLVADVIAYLAALL